MVKLKEPTQKGLEKSVKDSLIKGLKSAGITAEIEIMAIPTTKLFRIVVM